jgi:3-hydroxyisobutyrate dehydrogenase
MNTKSAKPRVAILGLGIMGSGMAGRLLSADFSLNVYNRNRERAKPFGDAGAFVADSPRDAAASSEIVISMVADDVASREVWLGENGALAGATAGTVLIESSTLTVGWVKELAEAASQHGCELLDAPVTGSKSHAASGELLFLVGGSEKALDIARPVLGVLGRDVIHFGRSANGALMKLINNFMSGVHAAALAEAVAFIQTSRIDRDKALDVLTNGAPGSPLVKLLATRATAGEFEPNFVLRLMAKDLGYAITEAGKYDVKLQTAAAALAVFNQAVAAGYGEKDFSAVIKAASESVVNVSKAPGT